MRIGSLETWIMPPIGWSSSRIRKTATVTEKAAATKATVVVALGGAMRLKLRKRIASQDTTAISIGLVKPNATCRSRKDRGRAVNTFMVAIKDAGQLRVVMKNIEALAGIHSVERIHA